MNFGWVGGWLATTATGDPTSFGPRMKKKKKRKEKEKK